MADTEPNFHDFSWSHSRDRLLDECARAYYWRYYGSYAGWSRGAGADARLAWRLKHLTTLHSVFGMAVHSLARECAGAVRDGRPRPIPAEMKERVRAALRVACTRMDRAAFVRDPKARPLLHSVYYHGRYDRAEAAAVATKMEACIRHLDQSPVWDRLERLPPEAVVLVEAHDCLEWEGLRVYSGPDLVILGDDGSCDIVDWKTGRRTGDEGAREQLATYGWFLERKLRLGFVEGRWTARAVYLQDGAEEAYVLTRLDLMRAEHRIRESAERMRGYLADVATNQPLPREQFPLLHPAYRFRCGRCPYFELCAREENFAPSANVPSAGPRLSTPGQALGPGATP